MFVICNFNFILFFKCRKRNLIIGRHLNKRNARNHISVIDDTGIIPMQQICLPKKNSDNEDITLDIKNNMYVTHEFITKQNGSLPETKEKIIKSMFIFDACKKQ